VIDLATDVPLLARFAHDLDPRPPAPPRALAASEADRAAARVAWAHRIIDEYRSVVVFSELLGLLAELEAPYPALCAVQHLIGDELRHARRSVDVVGWLGGAGELDVDLAGLGLPPRAPGESRGRRALLIVARELVVAEEESIVVLAACRDATTEPACRGVLAELLRDEVRHAATGRALYRAFDHGALARAVPAIDRADVPAMMAADRAALRAGYREAATGGPGRTLGASITVADLDAAAARIAVRRARWSCSWRSRSVPT